MGWDEKSDQFEDLTAASSTKMNSKLSLILLGALVTLAVLSAAENPGESSLSEEVASSRLARAADAGPGKKGRKSKKNKKASKKNKSKRNNKKASRKDNKSKNKKASKKEKKLKRKNEKASKKDKKSKRKNKKASKREKKSEKQNIKTSKKNRKSEKKNKKASKKDSKKDRKSEKKNKKASKKDRKSERKNKKASKKVKKSERKNKKRKSKQNKKKNSRKSKSQEKNREGRSTVNGTCISTAVNALYNGYSKKATNFDRQLKRLEVRLPKIANKLAKASEYNETLDDLVALGSCPAGNATELDALIATLSECQINIETACAEPEYNQTQIDECKPIVEGFVSEVEKCFDLNSDPAAACECWESDALAELEEGLKGCVIKESEKNVTDAFKACKGAVSSCNKAEAEAIPVLVACSKTSADLVAEAETVANNIAALEGAKAAVEAAAASRSGRHRAVATNCTEFIALVDARKFSAQSSKTDCMYLKT